MKSFLISCVILALVFTLAACNQHLLAKTVRELSAYAAALPASVGDSGQITVYAAELERIWYRRQFLFSLCVPASRTDPVERAILMLGAAADGDGYTAARADLLFQLDRFRESETLSLRSIL